LARIWIELEGRELEVIEALASIDARLARLEVKADSPTTDGWLSTKGAARYLDTTEVAIRSLVQSGKLEVSRNGSGNLMFRPEWLDRHAQAGSNGR
jgi:hypothetical protein